MDKKRIEELEELHRLLLFDLRNIQIMEKKIGKTQHQEAMLNKFLDQLSEINKELEKLKMDRNGK